MRPVHAVDRGKGCSVRVIAATCEIHRIALTAACISKHLCVPVRTNALPSYRGRLACPTVWERQEGQEGQAYSANARWTNEMAIDPSPTADATRLMLPHRTSPTAKMPGSEVSSR